MELPQYTVYVETPRLLFPKTLKLILLGLVLYVVIWFNFYMMKKPLPFIWSVIIMLGIVIMVVATTILNYTRFSNYQYRFYSNRIEYYGEIQQMIYYYQIQGMRVDKNMLDSLFNTGTINLGVFKIKSIPNLNQVYFYVQKMVQMYTQMQQQRQGSYPQNQGYQQQAYPTSYQQNPSYPQNQTTYPPQSQPSYPAQNQQNGSYQQNQNSYSQQR